VVIFRTQSVNRIVFPAFLVNMETNWDNRHAKIAVKILSLIPQSKRRVRTVQQERHRRQGVLRVLHVLLDKQAHPVMNVLKGSIVLDLIISQQFVVTVLKDITKETMHKHPAFHAYQVNTMMY